MFAWCDSFLDEAVPLSGGKWSDVTQIEAKDDQAVLNGGSVRLQRPEQFAGFTKSSLLFVNNGLHIEIKCVPFLGLPLSYPAFTLAPGQLHRTL